MPNKLSINREVKNSNSSLKLFFELLFFKADSFLERVKWPVIIIITLYFVVGVILGVLRGNL